MPLLALGAAVALLVMLQGTYLCWAMWLPGPDLHQRRRTLAKSNAVFYTYYWLYVAGMGVSSFVAFFEWYRLLHKGDGDLLMWSLKKSPPPQSSGADDTGEIDDGVATAASYRSTRIPNWWIRAVARAFSDLFYTQWGVLCTSNVLHHFLFLPLLVISIGSREVYYYNNNTDADSGDWRWVDLGWLFRTVAVVMFFDFRGILKLEDRWSKIDRWAPQALRGETAHLFPDYYLQQFASFPFCIPALISDFLWPAIFANWSQRICTTLLVLDLGLEAWQRGFLPLTGPIQTPQPDYLHIRSDFQTTPELHSVVFAWLPHFLVLKYLLEQYWMWRQKQQESMEEEHLQQQQQSIATTLPLSADRSTSPAAEYPKGEEKDINNAGRINRNEDERKEAVVGDFIIVEDTRSIDVVYNRSRPQQQHKSGGQKCDEQHRGEGDQRQPLPTLQKRNLLWQRRRHLSEPRSTTLSRSRCFPAGQPLCQYCSMELFGGMVLCNRCSGNHDLFFCERGTNDENEYSRKKKDAAIRWWQKEQLSLLLNNGRNNNTNHSRPSSTHHIHSIGPFGCLVMEPLFDWLFPRHRQLWNALLDDGERIRRQ
jgi:hypothetical protein